MQFNLGTVFLVLAILANIGLGFLVLRTKTTSATSRLFFLMTLNASLWITVNYLSVRATTSELTLAYARTELALATIHSMMVFFTVHTYPMAKVRLKPLLSILTLGSTLVVSALCFTPLIFASLSGYGKASEVTPGPLIFLVGLANILIIGSSIATLVGRIRHSKGEQRRHAYFLLGGVLITNAGGFFTNFILVNIFHFNNLLPVPPYLSLGFAAVMVYAILTQHLFDIRIFIRRTVIFSSLVAFAFLTYSLIVYVATVLLGSRGQLNTGGPNVYIDLITIIIVGFSYEPIKVWLSERTDKWLFKKEYEQEVVIKELSQKLNNVIALDEALEVVMHTTAKALHLHHAVTYVFQQADRGEQAIKRIKQIGYASTQRLILEERDFVMAYFCSHSKIIFTENFLDELAHEKLMLEGKKIPEGYKSQAEFIREHAVRAAVAKKLEQLEVAVAMPLVLKDQPIGLILLSSKQSNESYSKQDLTLLELVGDQAISSIQKAKLYEGDQMKSEFVSIASHELLTPISAIEGYLSMILDEKIAGKGLDPQTTDYLSKCFSSAKRLSMLVKDLLSVSRIESGKMKFTAQQLDSTKSIQDTIDQLRFIAQEKQITLKFKKPEPAFPPVLADPDRTSQVLINLVSNAIKYNRAGGEVTITTELLKKEQMVSISVRDNGLGMDKDQMSHLFEKFYRVDTKETMGILGTGLGLYITKSIVERMGGAINVQSTPGKGSAFTFTIPLLQVEKSIAT
ncbi:hypothetical protein BH11PAT4_BH11PAT4_4920 [soil metagenome]